MIYLKIAVLLQSISIIYLLSEVKKCRKLINDLAKTTKKGFEHLFDKTN